MSTGADVDGLDKVDGSRNSDPASASPTTPGREPRWRLLYAAVLLNLALLIILFYAFTRAFQ